MMEEFASETDSDYTSYWRDWVGTEISFRCCTVYLVALSLEQLCTVKRLCCQYEILNLRFDGRQPCGCCSYSSVQDMLHKS